jgi:excisionase family DNA binding protein
MGETSRRLRDVPLPPPEQNILTRLEACRVARVGTSTFDKAVASEAVNVMRNGRRVLVKRAELERWMETGFQTQPSKNVVGTAPGA